MQQTYKRTPMPKCDFNKVAARVFSCKSVAYLHNTFSQEHLWMAASGVTFFDDESRNFVKLSTYQKCI